MSQLFINIVGHNSSGKTTIAKKLQEDFGFSRVNGDDFRLFIYENVKFFAGEKLGKKSPKNDALNKFIINYRIELSEIVLKGGGNVVFDGSGATQQWRSFYMDRILQNFPDVKRVIIYTEIKEDELLKRLAARDSTDTDQIWVKHYHELKKDLFEAPNSNEADALLIYNQENYEEIKSDLAGLLES